jgi:hypothetical protein
MKFKEFSDFTVHFSIRIKDLGRGGLIWRWRDNFNYYFFELFDDGITIGKFFNGRRFDIYNFKKRYDTDKWFRFIMVVNQFNF